MFKTVLHIKLALKRSKTCKHSSGVNLIIGCTESNVCPMLEFLKYRTMFDNEPHTPLFLYKNHISLSRDMLVTNTRLYIAMIGINPDRYSGHSYRLGGATSMAASGFTEWEIMMLGRWSSDVYLRYIPLNYKLPLPNAWFAQNQKHFFSHLLPYKFK